MEYTAFGILALLLGAILGFVGGYCVAKKYDVQVEERKKVEYYVIDTPKAHQADTIYIVKQINE